VLLLQFNVFLVCGCNVSLQLLDLSRVAGPISSFSGVWQSAWLAVWLALLTSGKEYKVGGRIHG